MCEPVFFSYFLYTMCISFKLSNDQQNDDKLKALKLSGMAEAYESFSANSQNKEMDFDSYCAY